ncbi:MAG: ABC transporter ATP-binding protein [Thermomicrobiales bacterium]
MLDASVGMDLPDFSIEVELVVEDEILVLFGPSGAGKTMTIKMIAGLERPDRGRVQIGGRTVYDDRAEVDLTPQLRNVGYVPQGSGVFPHLTALENVALPLLRGRRRYPKEEAVARSLTMLERFGLRTRANARPAQMSGGEIQRVALARVLATEPDALLVDEPFAALDAPVRSGLRREFREFQRELGVPAIFITHDIEEAAVVGDRLAIMVGGEIRQTGKPREVLDAPADRDVAALVQAGNMYDGHIIASPDGPVVEAAVGSLRVAGCGLSAGQRVTAVIRPEGIRVLREDRDISRFADATILQGVIVEIADHGALTSVTAVVGSGHMTVTLSPTAASNLQLLTGKPIRLAIPPERIHLILS